MTDQEKQKSIDKYRDRLDEQGYKVVQVKSSNCFLVDNKEGQRQTVTFIK